MIETYQISVTVAGTAGIAVGAGSSTRPASGRIRAVYIDYTTQPATCDVTVATKGSSHPVQTILTRTNSGTDGWFYPRALMGDTAGANLTAIYDALPVDDQLTVTVAQGDAGSVLVYVLVGN